jgi:Glyoxalase-like domain
MNRACHIDHITVTAPALESGVAWVRARLGVTPQPGGTHPRMGTHNCLLRLGDSIFLEVIAPDPDAARPNRPRWFELDAMKPDTPPKLAMWVVRTTDIRATLAACPEPLGEIEPMSRGALDWLITIPANGSLPFDGCAPALIQWHADKHPALGMVDEGCALAQLEIFHPQADRLSQTFSAIGFSGEATVSTAERPALRARILTPDGPRLL